MENLATEKFVHVLVKPNEIPLFQLLLKEQIFVSIAVVDEKHVRLLIRKNNKIYCFTPSKEQKINGARSKLKYLMDNYGDGLFSARESSVLLDRFQMQVDFVTCLDEDLAINVRDAIIVLSQDRRIQFKNKEILKHFIA